MRLTNTIYSLTEGGGRGYYDLIKKQWVTQKSANNRNLDKRSIYSIPVNEIVSFSKWVNTNNRDLIDKIVKVEVESYPLTLSLEPGKIYSHEIVGSSAESSLVHIVIFPGDISNENPTGIPEYQSYFPSFSFIKPPKDGVALWQEDNNWVAGFSRSNKWVHVCTLGSAPNPEVLVSALNRNSAELALKEIIPGVNSVTVWAPESADLSDALATFTDKVTFGTKPSYIRPSRFEILPNIVAEDNLRKSRQSKSRVLFLLGLLIICSIIFATLFDLKRVESQATQAQTQLAALQPEAAVISGVASEWEALGSITNPSKSPIEVLFLLSKLSGSKGIRFLEFEMKDESTIIFKIQASTMRSASAFESKLESSPDLAGFSWKFSPPRTINKLVTFSCRGQWKQ